MQNITSTNGGVRRKENKSVFCRGTEEVTDLGQYFTPRCVVERMLRLRQNQGSVLEPSAGQGAFLRLLEKNAVAIEIDATLTNDPRVVYMDYFEYPITNKFDTIIGNPPYVRFQDISLNTRTKLPMELFDYRSNLYLFFIGKSVEHLNPHGELIFITPRDFLKATSAKKLNEVLFHEGTLTHYIELGDAPVFTNATPNCAIWRWEKGKKERRIVNGSVFQLREGQIYFGQASESTIGDYFDVKVGAVSGADDVFANETRGCTDMVCSTTARDGKTRRMIYNRLDSSLEPYKERLLRRKIRNFNDNNWWQWGRKYCVREGDRIYVNGKTRNEKPFFISDKIAYDGSVLALFPKSGVNLGQAEARLNNVDWEKLGFVCDGRLLFTQRSLQNAPVDL